MKEYKYKIFVALIILSLIFSLFTIYIYSEQNVPTNLSARAAVLYCPETDTFLFEKNKNERLGMASTTKIMTAIIVIENSDTERIVKVDQRAIGIEGSSVYLKQDEEISVLSLLYALMLRSANDAAVALAYDTCGSIDAFCELMNLKARELGLYDTSFTNPHGLDDENHYTTAHDLAIITAYALSNRVFKDIVSTHRKTIHSSSESRLLVNHNKLLNSYENCIGVKTGYTKKSGRSLVSAAERDGCSLIAVTINDPNDWRDHKTLLDYGFSFFNTFYQTTN